MPAGVVKTAQDEKDWARAKESCATYKKSGQARYYRCVMGTFMRIKKNRQKAR